MSTPTVGRVVWYHPQPGDPGYGEQVPLAAIICYVWSDECVNLAIFDRNGHRYARQSVWLRPAFDPAVPGQAAWPLSSVGQAEQMAIVTGGGIMDRVAALERAVLALAEGRG